MRRRDSMALVMAMALVSGCFQEEAPRQGAPVVITVSPANLSVAAQRTIETNGADAASVESLEATLNDSADSVVRREAIYSIADAGEPEDAAIIGQALTDSDSAVRKAAIEALTGIGGERSAEWLSLGLGDPDPRVRQTAVEALGEIGGDTARFLLQQALADVDQAVREAAQQMLEEPAFAQREFR
jgi:HEAT repeat protein